MNLPDNNTENCRVSVIIPCRNEEKYIGRCLRTVFENDFPAKKLEVLVVDGRSEDKTRSVVKDMMHSHPNMVLLDNPQKTTPAALNVGLKNASGRIIIRMDAHARYPKNYISSLVKYLKSLNADNVGGAWEIKPGKNTVLAKAIALASASPFGIGNAWYKLPGRKLKEVDTVPYGCYQKEVFERIGYFDEELIRNQDDEFNARLRKNGGKIFLIPDIKIEYFARPDLKSMSKMFYGYGFFKPLVNFKTGRVISARQLVPLFFVLYLLSLLIIILLTPSFLFPYMILFGIYVFLSFSVSFLIALRNKDFRIFFFLPAVFLAIHISYGTGYLAGLLKFSFRRNKVSG